MTTVHRILCEVTPLPAGAVSTGWQATFQDGSPGGLAPRDLRMAGVAGARAFPLPPLSDLPSAAEPHRPLCDDLTGHAIQTVLDRLTARTPQPAGAGQAGDIEQFGRYLFQTLFGTGWLTLMARVPAGSLVELALFWPVSESALHRLPWEMLCSPQGFLAEGNPQPFTITRLVNDEGVFQSGMIAPRPPASPVRVLFVAGASLQDPDIRAGAEYFGLLRELESRDRRYAVVPRTLLAAKPREIMRTMGEFRPEVVHFICHGVTVDDNGCLVLQLDDGEKDVHLRVRNARQLRQYLAVPDSVNPARTEMPALVILSACFGGTVTTPGQTLPLAAELVRRGVPAVVAMAGEVADQACRLFTRAFGEAILAGLPITAAMAHGRRAVFACGGLPGRSVDWALPTLYVSRDLPTQHAVATTTADPLETEQQQALLRYGLPRLPAFAARDDLLEESFRLLREGRRGALALTGDSGFGKTRLLLELAALAVRDGQVPIVLASEKSTWQPPLTLDVFIDKFLLAMQAAGSAYGIAVPPSRLSGLLRSSTPPAVALATLPQDIQDARQLHSTWGLSLALKLAMCADLEALVAAIKPRSRAVAKADGRPWLLLDELHWYDKTLVEDLFGSQFGHLLGSFGLGDDEARRIPVGLAYTVTGPAIEILKAVKEQPHVREWLLQKSLDPFDLVQDEDLLAYGRVLLHPHDPALQKGVSDVGWAFNPRAPANERQEWIQELRDALKHIPADFNNQVLYFWVKQASRDQVLVKADDEAVLRQFKP